MTTATAYVYRREVLDRPHLAAVRHAVVDAARRGVREVAVHVPRERAEAEAMNRVLSDEGFRWTPVDGEDGRYLVVHW
jgi:hypothetical protein